MLQPQLFSLQKGAPHILCLGAHCDDIEIGCGASLLKLLQAYPQTQVTWVVFTSTPLRKEEATKGARAFTQQAQRLDLRIFDLRDSFLPYIGGELKDLFEELKKDIPTPDLIFTHYRHDLHQDHRKVSELTWNTFRNHLILEYEIPKWDGDLGQPNTFIEVSQEFGEEKIRLLLESYPSQKNKHWFADDLFRSLMRIRGMECNAESRLAEGFFARKLLLGSWPE